MLLSQKYLLKMSASKCLLWDLLKALLSPLPPAGEGLRVRTSRSPLPQVGEGLGVRTSRSPLPQVGEGLGVRTSRSPLPRAGEGLGVRAYQNGTIHTKTTSSPKSPEKHPASNSSHPHNGSKTTYKL